MQLQVRAEGVRTHHGIEEETPAIIQKKDPCCFPECKTDRVANGIFCEAHKILVARTQGRALDLAMMMIPG